MEQVLVAPGCKMALSLTMMALIEPGEELYPDPELSDLSIVYEWAGSEAGGVRAAGEERVSAGNRRNSQQDHAENANADFQFAE